jgi:hypothetical protein
MEVPAVVRKADTDGKQITSGQMTHQTDQHDHDEFDLVPVVVACNVDILETDSALKLVHLELASPRRAKPDEASPARSLHPP